MAPNEQWWPKYCENILLFDIGHWTLDMADLAGGALSLVITCRILQMPCWRQGRGCRGPWETHHYHHYQHHHHHHNHLGNSASQVSMILVCPAASSGERVTSLSSAQAPSLQAIWVLKPPRIQWIFIIIYSKVNYDCFCSGRDGICSWRRKIW